MLVQNFFLFLSVFGLSSGLELPSGCEVTGSVLICKIRTIGGVFVVFDSLPTSVTSSISELHLLCNDVSLTESFLKLPEPQKDSLSVLFGSVQLKKLTFLQIDYCTIRVVPPKVFASVPQLQQLSLRTHNSDSSAGPVAIELTAESFTGLRELRQLDLSDNNIVILPSEVFCSLISLKTLNLTRNHIQDVSQLGFSSQNERDSCNAAVETLDLSQNDITSIQDGCLSRMPSLTMLLLQRNALSSLEAGALSGLTMLQVLNLSSNFISLVPPDFLQSARDIKQLYMDNNSLSVLSPRLFDGLEQLQVLDLSNNQLTSKGLNKDTFLGLVRMIVLNLSHNFITILDSLAFRNLYSLQILNLEHNMIEDIADNSFIELKNLHALTLSRNKIKIIGSNIFSELYVLNQLYLDNNLISYIHQNAFENVTNLQDLSLSANKLNHVPEAIKNLRLLKSLDLGRNNISVLLNSSFEGLDRLYGLRLVDNKISKVFLNTFKNLPSLQVLNLASNNINTIESGSFDSNPSLSAIRVDSNKLRNLNGLFEKLSSLIWLNVSDNEINHLNYEDLPISLEWFNVNGNRLKSLPKWGSFNTSKIKMLDASFNQIESIDSTDIPRTVQHLYLNDNSIKLVQIATFLQKNYLIKVFLYGNAIQSIDIGAFALSIIEDIRNVPEFYISGNPFKCDCSLEWLQRINNQLIHTRQYPRVADIEQVSCSLTHSRRTASKRVLELTSSQFLCPYESHCFALCHCCDFDACDCEMTCPKNCTCYHDLTWTANVVDCSNAGYTGVPVKIPMDATELYLDGNDFRDLGSHVFIGKKKLQVLFLNNSNLQSVHNRTFKGVESLKVLHLENNKIQELRGDEFDQLHNLNELYLNHNSISRVGNDTFKSMINLEVLRLDENKIVNFSPWQLFESSSRSLAHVSLEGNRWSCDCQNIVRLDFWLRMNSGSPNKMFCFSNNHEKVTIATVLSRCGTLVENSLATSIQHPDNFLHSSESVFIGHSFVSMLASIVVLVILVSVIGALIFAFRHDFRIWAFSRYGVRLFKGSKNTIRAELDPDRIYDAYFIYSIQDAQFVTVISSVLEQSGFSICLHYRDVYTKPHVSYTSDSIASITEVSKRIVVILTLNFLSLEWRDSDIRNPLLSTLETLRSSLKSDKIIFILSTEVSAVHLDADLQVFLRSHGVFYWGEKRFWDKLRFAMPDLVEEKSKQVHCTHSLKITNLRHGAPPHLVESLQQCRKTLPPALSSRSPGALVAGGSTDCGRGRTYFV